VKCCHLARWVDDQTRPKFTCPRQVQSPHGVSHSGPKRSECSFCGTDCTFPYISRRKADWKAPSACRRLLLSSDRAEYLGPLAQGPRRASGAVDPRFFSADKVLHERRRGRNSTGAAGENRLVSAQFDDGCLGGLWTMRRSRVLRILIVAIVLVLPVELVATRVAGSEPYPAAYMPSFGGIPESHGSVVVHEISVKAETTAGEWVTLTPASLIPNETKLGESIASNFFVHPSRVRSAAQSGWLVDRLRETHPRVRFSNLRVTLSTVCVDIETRSRWSKAVNTYSVKLKDGVR